MKRDEASVADAGTGVVRSDVDFPCGKEGVAALLPHRDPFVWVSRILSCEPGVSLKAELDLDPDLPLFRGHFPGHPVFPGVLVMEALAQAACCCLMADGSYAGKLGYLAGIDKAKFRNQALPGTTLTLDVAIVKKSSRMCVADVVAGCEGKVCAEATQKYVLAPVTLDTAGES